MTIIKMFVCGHWIVDPHERLTVGLQGPCHYCYGQPRLVIAKAVSDATFIPGDQP